MCQSQLPSGEWPVYASPTPAHSSARTGDRTGDSTPFATALVLYCVRELDSPRLAPAIAAALGFLEAEMRGPGMWTYWSSSHPRHREAPPDLDDIACVSWVLRDHGVAFDSCEQIVLDHRNPAGLFYTWLIPRAESSPALKQAVRSIWRPSLAQVMDSLHLRDITDMGVIANALLFLGQDDPRVAPSLAALIAAVQAGREVESGDYYVSRAIIWYFISRAYRHGVTALEPTRAPILLEIAARLQGPVTTQDRALMICTLLNFDAPEAIAAQLPALLEAQSKAGCWAAEAAYILGDRERGGGLYYGSEALTTGFCLEAISRWARRTARAQPKAHDVPAQHT